MKSTNAKPVSPGPSTSSSPVWLVVKLLLGGLLITYVLRSRMIDFHQLGNHLFSPLYLSMALAFLAFSALCCAARWYILVRVQNLSLSLKQLIELTMIGNFFNSFMPGSVGGDFIKAWYVAGREPQNKTKAVMTVFLDRAIGLSVIVFYSAATILFFPEWVEANVQLKWVAAAVWGFTLVAGSVGLLFFWPRFWETALAKALIRLSARWAVVDRLVTAITLYRSHLVGIVIGLLLGTVSVFMWTALYKWQGDALGISAGWAHYFFMVPIVLTAAAVPLLPGGLGVGQVAFFTLFTWLRIPNPEQGATLCTIIQIYTLLFNSLGIFYYLRFRRQPQPVLMPATS